MGLLDIFRKKEENVHFVRNEAGEVVDVQREYSGRSSTPVSDKLLSDAKKQKNFEKIQFRQQQKEAYDKAFRKARIERMTQKGRIAGKTTMADRFSNYSTKNNYNPFGSMFDTGIKYKSKPSKSSSSKKYTVVGGKSYPIASTKSKKKKKKSRSSGGYDMFDNWGYMK